MSRGLARRLSSSRTRTADAHRALPFGNGEARSEAGFDLIALAQSTATSPHRTGHAPPAERALRLHESCLPADSPVIATDLASLALTLCLLGEHRAALPLFARRGAQILHTRLGRTHPKTEDAFALVDLLR